LAPEGLREGGAAPIWFKLRQPTLLPEGSEFIGEIIVVNMKMHEICCVGGLELGAVPVVSAVASVSHLKNYPVDAFLCESAKGAWRAGSNRWECALEPKCS
jgi:orotate phosphoribosyltransferase